MEKRCEGAFLFKSFNKNMLCKDFFLQRYDQVLLQGVDQTMPFWTRALDMADKIVNGEQRPEYAVDVESSLFLPDSTSGWLMARVCMKDASFSFLCLCVQFVFVNFSRHAWLSGVASLQGDQSVP